jgi:hypothetical protein
MHFAYAHRRGAASTRRERPLPSNGRRWPPQQPSHAARAARGDAEAQELFRSEYLNQEDAAWNGLLGMRPAMIVPLLAPGQRARTRDFLRRLRLWAENMQRQLDSRK